MARSIPGVKFKCIGIVWASRNGIDIESDLGCQSAVPKASLTLGLRLLIANQLIVCKGMHKLQLIWCKFTHSVTVPGMLDLASHNFLLLYASHTCMSGSYYMQGIPACQSPARTPPRSISRKDHQIIVRLGRRRTPAP
jgi:hypothetical protein